MLDTNKLSQAVYNYVINSASSSYSKSYTYTAPAKTYYSNTSSYRSYYYSDDEASKYDLFPVTTSYYRNYYYHY